MNKVRIAVERLPGTEDLPLPNYMTELSAGLDVHAAVTSDLTVQPGERVAVPTGLVMALPEGYEAQMRPRSGLAIRNGITLANSPGTIDADYRGEIKILLINLGREPFVVKRGDRIAQMVVHQVCRVLWDVETAPGKTRRGAGGFGHTG